MLPNYSIYHNNYYKRFPELFSFTVEQTCQVYWFFNPHLPIYWVVEHFYWF